MTNFLLSAKTFENGQPIPIQYTADGRDLSPPLSWYSPPKKTKSFLVYMEDTDAGQEPFVHWLLYGIPGNCLELREGLPRAGILESPHGASHGLNSFPENNIGYRGPDPPPVCACSKSTVRTDMLCRGVVCITIISGCMLWMTIFNWRPA